MAVASLTSPPTAQMDEAPTLRPTREHAAGLHLLLAPNAFKGTARASEAAQAMALGIAARVPSCTTRLLPLADGGDGTIEALAYANPTLACPSLDVPDALGCPCRIELLRLDERSLVLESAQSCRAARPAPRTASSYGLGLAIRLARERFPEATSIFVGLGGTLTIDGGAGMLEALGARLLDADGETLPRGGAALRQLERIDLEAARRRLGSCRLHALCDVDCPLLGAEGARLFMAQKGADPACADELEQALARFASVAGAAAGLDTGWSAIGGAGAAGGLGAAVALMGGELLPGTSWLLDRLGADELLDWADCVFTGEGCFDAQSLHGKAPMVLARRAALRHKPVVLLCGSVEVATPSELTAVLAIGAGPQTFAEARARTCDDLRRTAGELMGLLGTLGALGPTSLL